LYYQGIFSFSRFICFHRISSIFTGEAKIMAVYHQYYGMKKALLSTIKAIETDGRAGVI